METLEQLGVALGLASLAGVNLYLTVLVVGLAIRFDVLQLASQYSSLHELGNPVVLIVAAVFFVMQFLADKIPWLDTVWDTVHTLIRPIGGAVLGVQALGSMPGYLQVIAGLVAGSAALTTHLTKSGARLAINHSPEPASNVAASVTEDVAVVGGVTLALLSPVVALFVFAAILIVLWMIFPRVWRSTKTTLWLAWNKLKMPGRRLSKEPVVLARKMNDELRDLLEIRASISEVDVRHTIPCVTGKTKGIRGLPPNLSGTLVITEHTHQVHFAATRGMRNRLIAIPLHGADIDVDSRFLSENVVITTPDAKVMLRFVRGAGDTAEAVADKLKELVRQSPTGPDIFSSERHDEPAPVAVPNTPAVAVAPQSAVPDAPEPPVHASESVSTRPDDAASSGEPEQPTKIDPLPAINR